MAYESTLTCVTFKAGANLAAHQYKLVKLDSNGDVVLAGNGEDAIGVLQNDPAAAGREATVAVAGITKVIAGGNVTAGLELASDANGLAVDATTAEAIIGVALTAGAANDLIPFLLRRNGAAA